MGIGKRGERVPESDAERSIQPPAAGQEQPVKAQQGFGPPGSGQSGFGPPPTALWQAPSEVERGLYEAKTRQDWAAYFDVLAGAYLYHPMPRAEADADLGSVTVTPYWNPQWGVYMIGYFTHGVLPVPVEDPVYFRRSLSRVAEAWRDDAMWLAINPGTPCEAYFPATAAHRAVWVRHTETIQPSRPGTLQALRVGGPLQGQVAHGLACGALQCVRNGSLWNAMAWHGTGYWAERERLREWWGITTRGQWQSTIEDLLRGQGGLWEDVLEIRCVLAREYGGLVEPGHWRHAVARIIRAQAAEAGADDADTEAEIRRVHQLIGRITRYEARFRADGLLPANRYVRSVLAWYFGRASKMARWGLGARFCDIGEAEATVVRASRVSQVAYPSWEDFSAGYILGRCLHFDEEEFGPWYEEMLTAHRVLTSDPASPWLTIPWT